jgi:hypothetical protein
MFDLIEESAQWNYLNIIQLKNVIMAVSNCMKNTLVVSIGSGRRRPRDPIVDGSLEQIQHELIEPDGCRDSSTKRN